MLETLYLLVYESTSASAPVLPPHRAQPHAQIHEERSVIAAIVGHKKVALKLTGKNTTILQGEIMGLIMATIVANDSSIQNTRTIFTDHLNSTKIIEDIRYDDDDTLRLRNSNGRLYYRWLTLLNKQYPTTYSFTKGHTDDTSLSSRLNSLADKMATSYHDHKKITKTPLAPILTFTMDKYTPWSREYGWIESNIKKFISYHNERKLILDYSYQHIG